MHDDLADRLSPYRTTRVPAVDLAWPPDADPTHRPSLKAVLSWYRVTRLPRGDQLHRVHLPLAN